MPQQRRTQRQTNELLACPSCKNRTLVPGENSNTVGRADLPAGITSLALGHCTACHQDAEIATRGHILRSMSTWNAPMPGGQM